MRWLKKAVRLMVPVGIAAGLAFAPGAYAQSPVANGSFETGDLSGWNTIIPPGGSVTTPAGGAPGGGSFHAAVKTNGPGSQTHLKQSFAATAGDQITGWANYVDTEFGGSQPCIYTDPARVEILDSSNAVVNTPFAAQHCPPGGGNDGSTGWVQWSYTFPASGTYTVRYRIQNSVDSIFDGLVLADEIVYVDKTAPTASCPLGVNPSGKSEPDANAGFRQVLGSDNVALASLVITDGTFTSDPLSSGSYVKLTQAPGSAGSDVRPGPGVLAAHITTSGDPVLKATDWAGNVTTVACGPLSPPKK